MMNGIVILAAALGGMLGAMIGVGLMLIIYERIKKL